MRDFIYAPPKIWHRIFIITACILITAAFFIPRLPWIMDYPLVLLNPDSFGYLQPADNILSGQVVDFNGRNPLYPLFLTFILYISGSLKAVVITQHILTLASALFLIWAFERCLPGLLLPAAIAVSGHLALPILISHSQIILSEALLAACIQGFVAVFILSVFQPERRWYLLCSLLACAAYLVHPRALFLFAGLILLGINILIQVKDRKYLLYLFLPALACLAIFQGCLWYKNNFIDKNVTLDMYDGNYYFYSFMAPMWETDPSYPSQVNNEILLSRQSIPEKDKAILRSSWNADELYQVFLNSFIHITSIGGNAENIYGDPILAISKKERNMLAGQIARKALRSHFDIYIKFIWANINKHVSEWVWSPMGTYFYYYADYLNSTYRSNGSLIKPERALYYWEYNHIQPVEALPIHKEKGKKQYIFLPSILYKINKIFTEILARFFTPKAWIYGCFFVFLASIFISARNRMKKHGVFVLFSLIFLLYLSGFSIAVSGISLALNRYSGVTIFIQYLCLLCFPLLLLENRQSEGTSRQ